MAVVSIELLLDDETDARVRRDWRVLADAGLSSLAAHPSSSNRPHVTLLVRDELAHIDESAPGLVNELAAMLPLPATLGAPILFGGGGRRVLARSVLPSIRLLDLHRRLHTGLGSAVPHGDVARDAPFTRPGEWTPHVTLARRLRLVDLAPALELLDDPSEDDRDGAAAADGVVAATDDGAGDAGIRGAFVGLRRWDSATATVTALGGGDLSRG